MLSSMNAPAHIILNAVVLGRGRTRADWLPITAGALLPDLPLHREDAHGHFYPLSNWHFESPISYWDPAHHELWVGGLEAAGVIVGSFLLIRRGTAWRFVGLATLTLYAVYAAFAIRTWTSL